MSVQVKSKARIVVAGAGWWSQGWHLPLLSSMPHAEIAAIIEPCEQPRSTLVQNMYDREQLVNIYGAPVFPDIDSLLKSDCANDLDGIIICTPHATHAEIGLKALEAGLHILCEKPMTTDVEEAMLLVAAAAKRPHQLFVVNNSANWRGKTRLIYERVSGGELGAIKLVTAYFGVNLKWLFEDPNNVGWVKPSGSMLGNGFCWGQLSHTLAWIYKVTGLTPVSVFAFLTNSESTGADIYATIGVQCACGAKISISGTACQPAPDGDNKKRVDNLIVGTKGTVRYHGVMDHSGASREVGQGCTEWRFSDGREEVVEGFEFENLETGVGELGGRGPESVHAFVDGCLGRPCFVGADAEVGYKAVATLDAIYRSAGSGQAEAVRCM